jgi:hypothetical protein
MYVIVVLSCMVLLCIVRHYLASQASFILLRRGCLFITVKNPHEKPYRREEHMLHNVLFKHILKGTERFKNVNNYLITNIYSRLETGGQSSYLYLNVVQFFNSSVNLTPAAP